MTFHTTSAIDPAQLARLPMGRYQGDIHYLTTQADMDLALEDLLGESVTGFDTETRPAFSKGESYLPSLVQAATARAVYLFPLQRRDCAEALIAYLQAPGVIKAGIALAHDLRQLKALFPFEAQSVVDLGVLAKRWGIRQTGVRNLAGLILGMRVAKGNRTSNWAAPRLTEAQINYAATDAWVCRELYLRLQNPPAG